MGRKEPNDRPIQAQVHSYLSAAFEPNLALRSTALCDRHAPETERKSEQDIGA